MIWRTARIPTRIGFGNRDSAISAQAVTVALYASSSGMPGFWIGAGVDALIETEEEVYRRGGRGTRLTVAPLLSSGRRGAAVSLAF